MSNSGSKTGSSIMINKDYTWDQADIAGCFEGFRKINEEFLSLSDEYKWRIPMVNPEKTYGFVSTPEENCDND